jgi:hypothetical protein
MLLSTTGPVNRFRAGNTGISGARRQRRCPDRARVAAAILLARYMQSVLIPFVLAGWSSMRSIPSSIGFSACVCRA